jgi:hypothetical protein
MFPIEFEESDSGWVARSPGYQLTLEGGNAVLYASDGRGHAASIGMNIVGALGNSIGVPEERAPGSRNYLTGTDPSRWRRRVPLWERVRYNRVLKGVDVVYRGTGRSLEYDLVIGPGTDPAAVRISLTGQGELELDGSGNLVMHTAAGDVVQHKPVAYQMEETRRREVAAAFRLHGSRISFRLGAYDPSAPLIVDPVIDYTTWVPGAVTAVAADASGSAYIAGEVLGAVLPVTPGAYQSTVPGSQKELYSHLFVAKFSPDGASLVYCTYLGGSQIDIAMALAVDPAGRAVIGGVTNSSDFPTTPGAYLRHDPGVFPNSFV